MVFRNEYLAEVISRYPDRFFVCGMCEFRKPGFLAQAKELIARGFKAIKFRLNACCLQRDG